MAAQLALAEQQRKSGSAGGNCLCNDNFLFTEIFRRIWVGCVLCIVHYIVDFTAKILTILPVVFAESEFAAS